MPRKAPFHLKIIHAHRLFNGLVMSGKTGEPHLVHIIAGHEFAPGNAIEALRRRARNLNLTAIMKYCARRVQSLYSVRRSDEQNKPGDKTQDEIRKSHSYPPISDTLYRLFLSGCLTALFVEDCAPKGWSQ